MERKKIDMEKLAEHNCLWVHSQDDDVWYSGCGLVYLSYISKHNCPDCGKFIVIDYYKETLSKHTESKK